MTFPGVTTSSVFGGSPRRPAGRTMQYSTPESMSALSPTSFSSKTPPNALVILNPGESSAPIARPSVRMEEMSTIRFTVPLRFAASTKCTTPSLSTARAAAAILNGFPGTKPVHTTTISASTDFIAVARASADIVTSKPGNNSTSPLSTPSFFAFSSDRTAATTAASASPRRRSSSTTRRPVLPVAPTTSTVLLPSAASAGEDASGETLASTDAASAETRVWRREGGRSERFASAGVVSASGEEAIARWRTARAR